MTHKILYLDLVKCFVLFLFFNVAYIALTIVCSQRGLNVECWKQHNQALGPTICITWLNIFNSVGQPALYWIWA